MSAILHKNVLTKFCLPFIRILSTTGYEGFDKMYADEITNPNQIDDLEGNSAFKQSRARSIKVLQYFTNEPHLNDIKTYIPSKHFLPKRRLTLQHLYVVDQKIAKHVVWHMMPFLSQGKKQLVCETNAGLGLITSELLERDVALVRLYETCPEFRQLLKDFNNVYPNKVELYVKDIFHLNALSYIDKFDGGDRVQQVLKGVPTRSWSDDPVMTIVGPMPNLSFIRYLIKMLTLQQEIVTYGRIQIFALMKPMDYLKFVANPSMKLHVYQGISVLFQLFFECELLEKYPRKSFLPWETKPKDDSRVHAHTKVDLDYIYLVRINFKKVLPIETKHLLHFYHFMKQGFFKGKPKVIPTIEKWLPGIGVNLIAPGAERKAKSFPDMNIYTEFGHLTPTQILQIFLEMLEHPGYNNSPFVALVGSQLLKNETIESDLVNKKNTSHTENLQEIFR